jgi:hypothetical protein
LSKNERAIRIFFKHWTRFVGNSLAPALVEMGFVVASAKQRRGFRYVHNDAAKQHFGKSSRNAIQCLQTLTLLPADILNELLQKVGKQRVKMLLALIKYAHVKPGDLVHSKSRVYQEDIEDIFMDALQFRKDEDENFWSSVSTCLGTLEELRVQMRSNGIGRVLAPVALSRLSTRQSSAMRLWAARSRYPISALDEENYNDCGSELVGLAEQTMLSVESGSDGNSVDGSSSTAPHTSVNRIQDIIAKIKKSKEPAQDAVVDFPILAETTELQQLKAAYGEYKSLLMMHDVNPDTMELPPAHLVNNVPAQVENMAQQIHEAIQKEIQNVDARIHSYVSGTW